MIGLKYVIVNTYNTTKNKNNLPFKVKSDCCMYSYKNKWKKGNPGSYRGISQLPLVRKFFPLF